MSHVRNQRVFLQRTVYAVRILYIPLSALLLGTTFLQQPLQPTALMGMGLIMTGLAVMDGRWSRCRNAEALKRDRSESTKIVKNR